jgi:hypothetical protein
MDMSLGTGQQREENTVDGQMTHNIYDIEGYAENLNNTFYLKFGAGRVDERRLDGWDAIRKELENNDTDTGAFVELQSALGNAYIDIAEYESAEGDDDVPQYSAKYELNGRNSICSRILEGIINVVGNPDNELNRAYRAIDENMADIWRRCDDLLDTESNSTD